jgi:hypothetical protein
MVAQDPPAWPETRALFGPYADDKAYCGRTERCFIKVLPYGKGTLAKVTTPPPAGEAIDQVAVWLATFAPTDSDGAILFALHTTRGWYVTELFSVSGDQLRGDVPRIAWEGGLLRVETDTLMVSRETDDPRAPGPYTVEYRNLGARFCGVGPGGVPACSGEVMLEASDDGPRARKLVWRAKAAKAVVKVSGPKERQVGTWPLKFPRRTTAKVSSIRGRPGRRWPPPPRRSGARGGWRRWCTR